MNDDERLLQLMTIYTRVCADLREHVVDPYIEMITDKRPNEPAIRAFLRIASEKYEPKVVKWAIKKRLQELYEFAADAVNGKEPTEE